MANRRRLFAGVLIFAIATASAILKVRFTGAPSKETPAKSVRDLTPNKNRTLPAPPVDLMVLRENLNAATYATIEEQENSEAELFASQVADAAESLKNFDSGLRIGGAQQLAAYPTREAERLLLEALETDMEPEVRVAAANSLLHVKKPMPGTQAALLKALNDDNEDVRSAALETLVFYAQHSDDRSAMHKKLITELKRISGSKRTAKETREYIRSFLSTPE